jgi:hypothetical protein
VPIGAGDEETGFSAMAPWQRVLSAALRARSAAMHDRERRPLGAGAAGCLKRLLTLALLLIVVSVIALFLFGRALMHGLQP